MIEKLRRKPVEIEAILWDGTMETGQEIMRWTHRTVGDAADVGFIRAEELSRDYAALWVEHNRQWAPLPVDYWVAREIDGSGFYPLSPEGRAAGYE